MNRIQVAAAGLERNIKQNLLSFYFYHYTFVMSNVGKALIRQQERKGVDNHNSILLMARHHFIKKVDPLYSFPINKKIDPV